MQIGSLPLSDNQKLTIYNIDKKSSFVSYLLWGFLGVFGAHKFYLEKYPLFFCQIGIWFFILCDGFLRKSSYSTNFLSEIIMPFIILSIFIVDGFFVRKWVQAYNTKLKIKLGIA